jgi:hypothetical protein
MTKIATTSWDVANFTETWRGYNTVNTYITLTLTWKIKMYYSEILGGDISKFWDGKSYIFVLQKFTNK